jgi:protein-disulfide isomerase/uncharacterized membrane protein
MESRARIERNPASFSSRLWILAALSLLGLAVSAMLSSHYYGLRSGTQAFKSYCNLGETMNCDVVAASPYSELFAGLPLSSFSAGWYLAMLVIAFFAQNAEWRRDTVRALLAMSVVGTLFSVVYFFIMASVIKTYCVMCLILDGVNVGALLITLSLRPGPEAGGLDFAKWKAFAGVVVVSLLLAIGIMKTLDTVGQRPVEAREIVDSILASPAVPLKVTPSSPGFGPLDAKITIVEFSDFQCPFCRMGAMTLNSALNRYPGAVRVVFKHFPLDNSCNRKMDRPLHTFACEAAKVAACAHGQGKFKPVYETLFEKQTSLAAGKITGIAAEAGADPAKLDACMTSQDTNLAVASDIEEAIALDVSSTPTFFINGHRIAAVQSPAVWGELIERLLKQP